MNAKLLCFFLVIAGASCTILPLDRNPLLNAASNLLNRRKPTTTTPAPTQASDESSEESSEESSTKSSNPLLPLLDPLQSGVTILDNIRNWIDHLGQRPSTSTTVAPRRSTKTPSSTSSAAPAPRSETPASSSVQPTSTSPKPSSSSAAPSSSSAAPSSSSAAPTSSSAAPSSSSAAPTSTSDKPSPSSAAPSSSSGAPSSSSAAPSSSSAAPSSSTTSAPSRNARDISGSASLGIGSSSISKSININLLSDLINALKNVDLSKVKSLPQISLPQLPTLPDVAEAVDKARQLIADAISDVGDIQEAIAKATAQALRSADPNGAFANLIETILKTAYDVAVKIPTFAGLAVIQDGVLIAQSLVKAAISAASVGLSILGKLG